MVKVCSDELLEYLVNLFTRVWNSRNVPQDWKDALLTFQCPRRAICYFVIIGGA